MYPNTSIPLTPIAPISNWSVALYRKAEYDSFHSQNSQQVYGSFYIQLQQQASSSSPSRSDVLYLRYQPQRQNNNVDSYTFPFTIDQLSDCKLSPDNVPASSTAGTSTRFYNAEQQTIRKSRIFQSN